MPNKKHHIKLTLEERELLTQLSRKSRAAAIKVQRAKAMLAVDSGQFGGSLTDEDAAKSSGLSIPSSERLRKRVCEVGPIGGLSENRD